MSFIKTKIFAFLTLILCMGVFCITAYAADETTLTVNAAWVDGEMLRIIVTDANGGNSAIAMRLTEYVSEVGNREYISIQAVDLAGNKSDVIHIKNPYYVPTGEPNKKTDDIPAITVEIPSSELSESAVPDGKKPFTPDGSGTVMDNVTDGDSKEFFTIKSEDGSIFYLIVDRQRNLDNVYFLNAVTEEDLIALAQKNGREINNISAIPTTEPEAVNNGQSQTTAAAPEPETKPPSKGINGTYIFIITAVIAAGGAGYYFKIIKGKKNIPEPDEDEQDGNIDDDYDGGDILDEGSDDE